MDVVDLTDSAAFGDEQEAAVAIADSAKDGETPSAAELRARTESLTSRIDQIDARVAQLSAERARLDAERSTVRFELCSRNARWSTEAKLEGNLRRVFEHELDARHA